MALYEVLADGTIVHKAGKNVGNLDCIRTEVVYDMFSSDASKNWSYTSGLSSSSAFYNNDSINFNKYDSFRFTINIYSVGQINNIGSNNLVVEMRHDTLIDGCAEIHGRVPYVASGTWSNAENEFRYLIRIKNGGVLCRFYYGTTAQDGSAPAYAITRIEGVLKTPAMIYTGKELHEGNGISIKDGVISSNLPANTIKTGIHYTGQNDTVIESYVSSDGKDWYRIWASGWRECGKTIVANSGNAHGMIVTLPIGFSDSYFYVWYTATSNLNSVTGSVAYKDISIQPANNYQVRVTGWAEYNRQIYACGW